MDGGIDLFNGNTDELARLVAQIVLTPKMSGKIIFERD